MKKCVLCTNKAVFAVKDSSEYYCEECALENFSDIDVLTRLEDQKVPEKEPSLQDQIEDLE
ncbi:MAG TPA: hypothetical protein VJB90_05490 [Candidatus Nanoarchaeia archaeon]|nr:hypothetical protein [Candidatus Nanoarchaeia archaeon]